MTSSSRIRPVGAIRLFTVFMISALIGCSGESLERNPPTGGSGTIAEIEGFPGVRDWADISDPYDSALAELDDAELEERYRASFGVPHHYLAISGGGPRGAYTAGILNGWTEAGDRPEFTLVTGISTGGLIAPFAFLGSDYDHIIKEIYTRYSTEDVLEIRGGITGLLSDAIGDSAPLQEKLLEYVSDDVVEAIAGEYERGRFLSIVTSNLDAGRPVAWDIGAIAASGRSDAAALIRKVMLASASIPGGFPPVMFEVSVDGKRFDEMHVDGGASSVVQLYPMNYDARTMLQKLQVPEPPDLYVIRNGQAQLPWEAVERSTLPVMLRTQSTLMNTIVEGDIYRIFATAARDGLDFHVTEVPADFDHPQQEQFDRDYMRALYQLGYEMAAEGFPWDNTPRGF